jgi:hypothetical protein
MMNKKLSAFEPALHWWKLTNSFWKFVTIPIMFPESKQQLEATELS